MKKFTFLLAFFVIALMANSQISKNLQDKIEQEHEKYLKFSEMIKNLDVQSSSNQLLLKSTAATLKLDSIVSWSLNLETDTWNYDYKDEYFYNSSLKNTSWQNKEWNLESENWDLTGKTKLEFNNEGLVSSMLLYDWDAETGELFESGKFMIYYNSAGIQDSALMYFAETMGSPMVLTMKQVRHYNAAKQLIKTDILIADEETGGMVLSQNIVNTYESGKIKSSTTNIVAEGEEMAFSKIDYNYDGSGNLTSKVNSAFDFFTLSMVKTNRNTYEYNASGKVKVEISSNWEGGDWIEQDKTESEFNAAGDVSVDIYSEKNGASWNIIDKDEYLYSSNSFSGIVVPYFFNSFDLVFMVDMESVEQINFNKQITGVNSYDMINGEWKNTGKSTVYYSEGTSTKIDETQTSLFTVYPNPAAESVSFKWNGNFEELTLEMYQITGAKVLEQTTLSGKSVSLSNLEGGVYFYKLMDGKEIVHSGKLIKN